MKNDKIQAIESAIGYSNEIYNIKNMKKYSRNKWRSLNFGNKRYFLAGYDYIIEINSCNFIFL